MHTYNPLIVPDTIGEIIKNLPLEDLDKFCWMNHTWYKEIQYELRKRWKIQVYEFYKLELEKNEKTRILHEIYSDNEEFQGYMDQYLFDKYYEEFQEYMDRYLFDMYHEEFLGYMDQYLFDTYYKKLKETAKKQIEIEKYMLNNGMFYGQEKEIVKYNIQQIRNNEIPWGVWIFEY